MALIASFLGKPMSHGGGRRHRKVPDVPVSRTPAELVKGEQNSFGCEDSARLEVEIEGFHLLGMFVVPA
jgi:hypothetical protein